MNLEEYNRVKDLSYREYCAYLKRKYGEITGPYYSLNWVKNQKISRTKDGLYVHHIYEDHAIMLGDLNYAKLNPYEWQLGENLVYCDILEHMFLHILISEEPSEDKNANEDVGVGGVANFIVPELNDVYSGWVTKQQWRLTCHYKAIDSRDLYLVLIKRFNEDYKKHPTYKPGWYKSSFNGKVAPSSGWNVSNNKEIISEIEEMLDGKEPVRDEKKSTPKKKISKKEKKTAVKDRITYHVYSEKELIALFNYLTDEYNCDDINKDFDSQNDSIDEVFNVTLESEIAELTRVVVAHILEGHTKSLGLNYICLLLLRQIVVYRLFEDDDENADMVLHLCQSYGYNSKEIQRIVNSHFGAEKHIYYDRALKQLDDTFYDYFADMIGATTDLVKSRPDHPMLKEPFISVATMDSWNKWDDLCFEYIDSLPDSFRIYSFLTELTSPTFLEESNEEEIENIMNMIMNILIHETVDILNVPMLTLRFTRGQKYETAFQKIDSIGVFDRSQFPDKDFNYIANYYASKNDKFRSLEIKNIAAIYKSMYLCHEIKAYSVTIQLYEPFCEWLSFASYYDSLPKEDYKYRSSFYLNYKQFIIDSLIADGLKSDEPAIRDSIESELDEIDDVYDKYYRNKYDFKNEDDFIDACCDYLVSPKNISKFNDTNSKSFIFTRKYGKDINYCYDYYLISTHARNARIDVNPGFRPTSKYFATYISVSTLQWTNNLLASYFERLENRFESSKFNLKLDDYVFDFENINLDYSFMVNATGYTLK